MRLSSKADDYTTQPQDNVPQLRSFFKKIFLSVELPNRLDRAANVSANSASLVGNLTSIGTTDSVNVSFEWGLSTSYGNTTTSLFKDSSGEFSINASGLSNNTHYHFRVKAVCQEGTYYGPDREFDTGDTTTTFVYDGDGNRIQKTENGQTVIYVNKYFEKNLTTGNSTSYYFLGSRLVATKESASNVTFILQDHLGSTSVVSDSNGALVSSIAYFPFGGTRSGTVSTSKKFTGQRLDDTGLYFYNARYYDANIGRFISPDTIVPDYANPQSLNRYSYVVNNPLKYSDPTGQWAFDQFALGVGESLIPGVGFAVAAVAIVAFVPGGQLIIAAVAIYSVVNAAINWKETTEYFNVSTERGQGHAVGTALAMVIGGKVAGKAASSRTSISIKNPSSFRGKLQAFSRQSDSTVGDMQAHHRLPVKFQGFFSNVWGKAGRVFDIDNPEWGQWVDSKVHSSRSGAYNAEWETWIRNLNGRTPTPEEVIKFAKSDSMTNYFYR